MNGASRDALASARERLDTLLESSSVEPSAFAEELASVASLLDEEAPLRRVLTDPTTTGESKAELAGRLLTGKVSGAAIDLLSGMVRSRWSRGRDLPDVVEELSASAEIAAAERSGGLDAVEDELFRFGRIVSANPDLRAALSSRAAGADAKADLVRQLLGGRAHEATVRLVARLASTPRGRSLEGGLEAYSTLAAARRDRIVAVVTVAVPLTGEQKDRLGAALARLYGRRVALNVDIDQDVLGGLRVEIGDEVIDGTVSGRLQEARQQFDGS